MNLEELKKRSNKRKNDPNLRHQATPKEIKIYNENADDLIIAQMEAIALTHSADEFSHLTEDQLRNLIDKSIKEYRKENK